MSAVPPVPIEQSQVQDKNKRISSRILGVVFSMLLFACTTVGPDYQPPKQEMPQQWNETTPYLVPTEDLKGGAWWALFHDPLLDFLVSEATTANRNLRKALASVREARALRIIAAANGSVSASTGGSSSRRSDNTSSAGGKQDLFQLGFDARWELDIFGGIERATEAAEASLAAAHEELRDVLVSLQAEVVSTYLELRGTQKRIATTLNNIATQEKTVAVVRGRFQMGLGNELDLMNAENQLALTRAALPALRKSSKQSMHQLAILLGKTPESLISQLSKETTDFALPTEIPINLPSDLLRRRPDIRAAERHLAAATAEIGVAVSDLFPKFSLSALLGLQSNNLSDLLVRSSRYWSIGPTISLSLFDRGKIRANIEVRNARRDSALAVYEQKVLSALGEVENALVTFNGEQETQRILDEAVTSGQKAVTIANGLYEAGLSDFLNVLQSEKALYQSQDQLVLSEQRLNLSIVSLFKALGGGWYIEEQTNKTPSAENIPQDVSKIPSENHPT
jgi:outer membrane protein, multidrug efflux system